MTNLAIDVAGISKQYRIGQMHSAIDTLRDHLMHGLHTLRAGRMPRETIWALDDVEVQKRCVGKMEGYGQSGRTVLFVSHSMPTIARLCPRLLLLDRGRLVEDGPAEHVIGHYLHGDLGSSARREWPDPHAAP